MSWSHQVNDFSLLVSDCCPPSTIRSELDVCTGAISQARCYIYKLEQRLTEATFIYYALAEQEQFEGYLSCLQAPSVTYETNNINEQTIFIPSMVATMLVPKSTLG